MEGDSDSASDGEARVPAGVLQGIEDLAQGRTASKKDVEAVLRGDGGEGE